MNGGPGTNWGGGPESLTVPPP